MPGTRSRIVSILEAILVSIVWASSFILVKLALAEFGPLTISGLRYFGGSIFLLPFIRRHSSPPGKTQWLQMIVLGVCGYALANGALFWALRFLPATTVSFLMGLVSITVLLGGVILFNEIPNQIQSLGILVAFMGMALFFSNGLKTGEPLGLLIFILALIGFTTFGLLSRVMAMNRQIDTPTLTALPLAMGGGLVLVIAIQLEGIPSASYKIWGVILFLAVINTAVGYLLYFNALKILQAFEMNMILNLTPMWTAILGWLLLGEILSFTKWGGIIAVMVGILMIQKRQPLNGCP